MANVNERAELHKTIWKIANDLRGSVDGWEFKAYVLGSIFYRFISENICDYIHQLMIKAGQPNFDYTTITDEMAERIRKKMVEEKGYFILPSQLFQNVVKTADKDENRHPHALRLNQRSGREMQAVRIIRQHPHSGHPQTVGSACV